MSVLNDVATELAAALQQSGVPLNLQIVGNQAAVLLRKIDEDQEVTDKIALAEASVARE